MNPTLKFNMEFYSLILKGNKVATTRTHVSEGVEPGKVCEAIFTYPNGSFSRYRLLINIESILKTQLFRLGKNHAYAEGYNTKEGFESDLKDIYPMLKDSACVYVIEFSLMTPSEEFEK